MKNIAIAGASALAVAAPAVAEAKPTTRHHARAYERAYHRVAHKFGRRTPGRNIVKAGMPRGHRATDRQVVASLAILRRMLKPAQATASPSAEIADVSEQPSGSPLPYCTWGPESGGDWTAVNASSGAGGRYQILPSTWELYGGSGLPEDASPAQQTAIAEKIYKGGKGASNWVNC